MKQAELFASTPWEGMGLSGSGVRLPTPCSCLTSSKYLYLLDCNPDLEGFL